MIREKDLAELVSWNWNLGEQLDLNVMEETLKNNIQEYNYIADVVRETVSAGSLFSSKEYECIKIFHPEHPTDYFYYCIVLEKGKRNDVIKVYVAGKSTQLKMDDYLKNTKIFDGGFRKDLKTGIKLGASRGGAVGVGATIGYVAGSAAFGIAKAGIKGIGKGIAAMTRDKEAFEIEKGWYTEIQELIGGTFGN